MENELASIIVITYNRLEYTRYCLNSIIEKTDYFPYELIVVDNNSTDGTRSYLSDRQRKGLIHRLILLERNYGAGFAMNQGIRAAQGRYLIRSDNDMVYNQGWLKALVEALRRIPKAVLQVAVFGEVLPDGQRAGFPPEDAVAGVVVRRCQIGGCNMAFTRETFEDLGPFSTEKFCEDSLYCEKASEKNYLVGQIDHGTGTHIDYPGCPLSKRYTDYADYRIEILRNLKEADIPFLSPEDAEFYRKYQSEKSGGRHNE